ncbi:MAG: hypothetical protein Q7T71_14955, partial [Herbiconiux sp.]|nr:hypothetical protein [Herbiconiux sp.]
MARQTNADLLELVERLRQENEGLRAEVLAASAAAADGVDAGGPGTGTATRPERARRPPGRGRTAASVALLVVGLLLAPVAVVGHWAQSQLADTEAFVATFAPLARDESVRAFLVAEVMAAVDEQVDFERTTAEVFDAVGELGLPPAASAALDALKTPAALGLRTLATDVVTGFVESEAFAEVWEQSLRVSHRQIVGAMTGQDGSALALSSTGELSIQLAPVITAVKAAMVAQGLAFAEAIPAVDLSVVVAQSESFGQIQLAYALAVGLGTWLPWVTLLLLAGGVLLAVRRTVVLLRTALALGVLMVLLGAAVQVGGVVVAASLTAILPVAAAAA